MRKLFIYIVAFLILGGPVFCDTLDAMQKASLSLTAADYGITLYGLNHGYYEGNPLAQWYVEKPLVAVPLLVSVNLGFNWYTRKLHNNGHKIWAYLFQGVYLALRCYAVYHNLKLLLEE